MSNEGLTKRITERISLEQASSYYSQFRLLKNRRIPAEMAGGDLDVLVVLNSRIEPRVSLRSFRRCVEDIRDGANVFFVSDSYFTPLVATCKQKPLIIHLLTYHCAEHFKLSPYSQLIGFRQATEIVPINTDRLSWLMAGQDLLRSWCMRSFNELPEEYENEFRKMERRTIRKWFYPLKRIPDPYMRSLVRFIEANK